MKAKLSDAKCRSRATSEARPEVIYRRVSVDTEEDENIPNDPTLVKAEIFKNLDDANLVIPVNVGGDYTVTSICLSNDEKHVIIGNREGMVTMINVETKTVEHSFKLSHLSTVIFTAVTNDDVLVTCSKDGCVETFDAERKEPMFSCELEVQIHAATLTPDDGYLVVGTKDYAIQVWDICKKICLESVKKAHTGSIHTLAVTKDNKIIASGSADKSISLWTFENSNLIHTFKNAHFGAVQAVRFSEDGRKLYSSCMNGAISIWDVNKKKNLHKFINAHIQAIKGLTTIKDGRFLLSASGDSTIGVWDTETKAHLHTFKGPHSFGAIVATKNTRCAIAAGEKGTIYFVTLGYQQDHIMLKNIHEKPIGEIKLTYDANYIVSGGDDGKVALWNLRNFKNVYEIPPKNSDIEVWRIAISPNDKLLAVIYSDSTIEMFSLRDGNSLHSYNKNKIKRGACCVIFTRDSAKLIYCSHQPHIFFNNASSPESEPPIENAHQAIVCILDTTKNGKYLVSGSKDKSIAVWNLATKELAHRFENAHDATIWTLNLSYDGKYLISGSNDCTIKIWDFPSKKLNHVFETSHEEWIKGLYVAPNDSFFVSTDLNCNVEVHNLKTKQRALIFEDFKGCGGLSGAIARDNKKIIFSSNTSIHLLENPFNKLTVQYADACHPSSLLRFMPLTSFFSDASIPHRQNLIKSYPHLKVHPFGWNWFHIVGLYAPTRDMITTCLNSKIPFSVDIHEKTPLHYLLENDDTEIAGINLIMCNFAQILSQSQSPSTLLRLIGDILFQLIELDNQHVINLLNTCPLEPEPEAGMSLDNYGDIYAEFYLSDSMLYSLETKKTLLAEENKLKPSKQKISIHMLPFHWDYTPTSVRMRNLVVTLKDITSQGIFETQTVKVLIRYLWAKTRIAFYLLGLLFSVQAILISVYTGLGENNLGLEIPIFTIACFFLIYELFQMYSAGIKDYLVSVWNYIDWAGAVIVPGTLIAVWCGVEEGIRDWLFSFILAVTYIRWVSYFRVFKQTRKLIRMIVEIIQDIRSFATILAFVVFGLSLIFLQFDRDTPYAMHLFNSYRLLYSDYDTDDMSVGRIFYLVIILVLVSIVLLNMLITIMGDTFGEVKERSIIVDSKAQLELILECMEVHHTFNKIFVKKSEKNLEKKSYLFYIEQREEEEELDNQKKLGDEIQSFKQTHVLQAQQIDEQGRLLEEQTKMIREIVSFLKKSQIKSCQGCQPDQEIQMGVSIVKKA